MRLLALCVAALTSSVATAHTIIRSVYVNGVDQGTGVGIREPAFNGPPVAPGSPIGTSAGYQNSPVKNLTSPDMTCNVLGDIPDPNTIQVVPGDVLTFEWGHESRLPTDDIIASSHLGAALIYLSPNPPSANSWVKIFEEGEYSKGEWAIVPKLIDNDGHLSMQVPDGLKAGQYLVRSELIALHEGDASYLTNPNRGAQLYMDCVQIQITGNGTAELPSGVSFPGAYNYSDPGIVYNIYVTLSGAAPYKVPGPTVWSGAAPSPTNQIGSKKGDLTVGTWSTWVGANRVVTMVDAGVTSTSTYVPNWPTPTVSA